MTEIETRTQEIEVSDGSKMNLYVASPRGVRSAPGMIVLQEAFGVNAHMRHVTERFAREGFLAVAPELFHRTARNFEGAYDNFPAIMPHYQAVTEKTLRADFLATHEWFKKQPLLEDGKIASIGFCMGGRASYIANATLPLRAAVSYYGGGIAPDLLNLASEQHGPILLFWGGLDKHIPLEQARQVADALKKAGKAYSHVEFSYADHAFSNEDRPSQYNAKATAEAWALTMAFLRDHLYSAGH